MAIADIKMVFVNSRGTWTPVESRTKGKIENLCIVQQNQCHRHFQNSKGS